MAEQYFPSPTVFFKTNDNHPFVAIKGLQLQVPLSAELRGIDLLSLIGKQGMLLRVAEDQASFELVELGTASEIDVGTSEGNIPILGVGGKLDNSVIPAVAIVDVYEVGSQAAMLALNVEVGDVAIRSDESKSYILSAMPPSTLANWKWLRTPTDLVTSVAGKTGVVTLTKSDVGLDNVTNESKATMFTSPAFTGTPTAPNASTGTNTTQLATTKFVNDSISAVSKQVKVFNTVSQSIPSGLYTAINFDGETYDNANQHDNATNNTRITCVETARYLVHAQVNFANNATSFRGVRVRINGSLVGAQDFRNAVSGTNTNICFSFVQQLNAGDYIELEVYQNSGANLDVLGSNLTHFGMVKVL